MEPAVVSDAKAGDLLKRDYYCKIVNSKRMDVVLEMLPGRQETSKRSPLQYVLVIDVSGSMVAKTVGGLSRLQRVQDFAELAVREMTDGDWMSIVTFSSKCVTEMSMTRMHFYNKEEAVRKIRKLAASGGTNLERGLLGALEAIKSAPESRHCVILFTDGEANEGTLDPAVLIEKYKKAQSKIGLLSCVPVSAFTIEGQRPHLLIQISKELGGESFYWLDEKKEFEADMLIPFFLREQTSISDVDITIESLRGSYFDPVYEKAAHFKRKKPNGFGKPTEVSFFIPFLPGDNPKCLAFHVALPPMPPEEEKIEQKDQFDGKQTESPKYN